MRKTPRALSIAGSDSGGGAGIQADLKTFTAHRVYAMSVVTAVTVQDTVRVHSVLEIPSDLIQEQIDVVLGDIGADAVKTGMLPTSQIVEAVAQRLARWRVKRLVVDPVMVSTSGEQLMGAGARKAMIKTLFPLAELITPNIPEAEQLLGRKLRTERDLEAAGESLLAMGPRAVLIKGGHSSDSKRATDLLFVGSKVLDLSSTRISTEDVHGTGCTLSAAITANLARGYHLVKSCRLAKKYVSGAIRNSITLGHGQGLLDHAWEYRGRT